MVPRFMDTFDAIEQFLHDILFSWKFMDNGPILEENEGVEDARGILQSIESFIRGLILGIYSGS